MCHKTKEDWVSENCAKNEELEKYIKKQKRSPGQDEFETIVLKTKIEEYH